MDKIQHGGDISPSDSLTYWSHHKGPHTLHIDQTPTDQTPSDRPPPLNGPLLICVTVRAASPRMAVRLRPVTLLAMTRPPRAQALPLLFETSAPMPPARSLALCRLITQKKGSDHKRPGKHGGDTVQYAGRIARGTTHHTPHSDQALRTRPLPIRPLLIIGRVTRPLLIPTPPLNGPH